MPYNRRVSRWIQRAFLILLFAVFAILQARFTVQTVALLSNHANFPHAVLEVDPATLKITSFRPEVEKAGAKKGDVLLAVDGTPIHSFFDERRAHYQHQAGGKVTLRLRRGDGAPFEVSYQLPATEKLEASGYLLPVILNIITPWSCILLGFFVAFRRPGDPVAYALLALLLCASQLFVSEAGPRASWGPLFTWPLWLISYSAGGVMPVAWVWFAILFPDPSSRHKVLAWTRWALGLPFAAFTFLDALTIDAGLHNFRLLSWRPAWLDIPSWAWLAIEMALFGIGFSNLFQKLFHEEQPSQRRRLRWVIFGLAAAFLPPLLLIGAWRVFDQDPNKMPAWLLAPAVGSPLLIPVTLAYAVLVNRLFDIGIFVRQGLLASKTVWVVRILLVACLIWVSISYETRKDLNEAERWTIIAACIGGAFLIRQLTERLRRWVDRRFFQEAVNSEKLLAELSAQVRRITDPQTLMRTVADQVSNALHPSVVAVMIPRDRSWTPAYVTGAASAEAGSDGALDRIREQREPAVISDELYVPLSTSDELHGILRLGPKRSEEPYSASDIRLLESVANQTALALENGRLAAAVAHEAAHRERITSELEIARKVQERLFPKHAPCVTGLDLAGRCLPAQTVGGDYYDFLVLPGGGVGLAIGDVAGKGVPAALLMAGLQASLRGLTLAGIVDPADLMTKLNVLIYDATPANRFATFFYGLYEPATGRLQYCSAGHNPVVLYRADGTVEWLRTPGVGLGLKRSSMYRHAEATLAVGDALVLYTDGLTESHNEAGEEFGEDRLVDVVRSRPGESAGAMLEQLMESTCGFAAGVPQHDDITIIVARRTA